MQNPQRTEPLAFRKLGNQTVVIELGEVRYFHELNEAASLIWELCDGKHSPDAIAKKVAEEFEVDVLTARGDTEALLKSLHEKNLIHYS